jgi:predicted Zn-dependent protease
MVQFLEKLRNQPSPPAFLSTHPDTDDRIVRLREIINAQQANR